MRSGRPHIVARTAAMSALLKLNHARTVGLCQEIRIFWQLACRKVELRSAGCGTGKASRSEYLRTDVLAVFNLTQNPLATAASINFTSALTVIISAGLRSRTKAEDTSKPRSRKGAVTDVGVLSGDKPSMRTADKSPGLRLQIAQTRQRFRG